MAEQETSLQEGTTRQSAQLKTQPLIPKLRFKEFDGEWNSNLLGKFSSKIGSGSTPTGGNQVYQDSGIPFIRSQNVFDDKLFLDGTHISKILHLKMKGSIVKPNDILLNITGGSIGRSCVVPKDFNEGNVNQHVCIIRLKDNFNTNFIQSFLSSHKGQKLIYEGQTGSGREGINFQSIRLFKINIPSLPEQQKIASFLSVVDEKIQQLTQKKSLLEQYKKGVMQQLFSGELRFKDENGADFPNWEIKEIGEFIKVRKISASPDTPLYSLTIEHGVVPKSKRYERSFLVKGEESAYKLMFPNDFAFNPMNLRFGALARYKGTENVAVSKYYDIFYCKENCNQDYLESYLTSYNMIQYYNKMSTGTLEEKKRVHYLDFVHFKKLFPCIGEQQKIADYLSAIDTKIETVNQQIEKTQDFKKGLLQQMFV
ncbi:restriction endonuclease subunit S [Maribacter dokdonensis]|uniref:restriction endonuclease subunit S n=1 Tax=Maribacter dokdonensis TaxID=320912 RepID=UPI003275F5B1